MRILITTEQESELWHLPFTATLPPLPTLSLHITQPCPLLSSGSSGIQDPSLPISHLAAVPFPLLEPLCCCCCWLSVFCKLAISRCICCHGNIGGVQSRGKRVKKLPKNSWISPLFCALPIQIWPCRYISSWLCQESLPQGTSETGNPNFSSSPLPPLELPSPIPLSLGSQESGVVSSSVPGHSCSQGQLSQPVLLPVQGQALGELQEHDGKAQRQHSFTFISHPSSRSLSTDDGALSAASHPPPTPPPPPLPCGCSP